MAASSSCENVVSRVQRRSANTSSPRSTATEASADAVSMPRAKRASRCRSGTPAEPVQHSLVAIADGGESDASLVWLVPDHLQRDQQVLVRQRPEPSLRPLHQQDAVGRLLGQRQLLDLLDRGEAVEVGVVRAASCPRASPAGRRRGCSRGPSTFSPAPTPCASAVLPAPSGPCSSTTSPGRSSLASRRPSERVRAAPLVVIVRWVGGGHGRSGVWSWFQPAEGGS